MPRKRLEFCVRDTREIHCSWKSVLVLGCPKLPLSLRILLITAFRRGSGMVLLLNYVLELAASETAKVRPRSRTMRPCPMQATFWMGWRLFLGSFCFCWYFFGFRLNGFKWPSQSASQSVSRSASPPGSQSVSRSVARRSARKAQSTLFTPRARTH